MASTRKKTNLSFNEVDLLFGKMSPKERAKAFASGADPDDWDYNNISKHLKRFETKHPGLIARMANQVYAEVEASGVEKSGVVNKQADLVRSYWLPAPIQKWMEDAYPSIAFGSNKKHVNWFCRKFPVFSYYTYTHRLKVK